MRTRVVWLVLAIALCVAGALAESPSPPPFYAITHVNVVTGTGKTLEGATVLVADGLIEAVGKRIDVPSDAWVIDGEGLTLYPGLVDAMSTLGQKQEEGGGSGSPSPGGGGASRTPVIRGPQDRPKTTPWTAAVDSLSDEPRVEKWRKAGFTGTVTTPTAGLFAGQAAWINLGGSAELDERIVSTPVAQRLNFRAPGRGRGFPGSLMGSLSYIKQVFSDRAHYSDAKTAYRTAPLGRDRPMYDRTLEALETALEYELPFMMPAHLGREIDRALALAAAYELPALLYGGQGAYERVDALAASETPVLVSLNWPKEEKNADPDADTPFRTHYHRRMAPATPGKLAQGGVTFAFYSDGLATASEVFKNVRKAIGAGLSNEEALAALTSSPARVFGVANRVGTIEKGKIANLVLASDWPWAEGVEIHAVFVDGHKYEERKSDEPTEPPASDVSGTWKLTVSSPRGSRDATAELEMAEDGKVTGDVSSERGTTSIEEGRMSGEILSFKMNRSTGSRSFTASYSMNVEGESLAGTMSAGPMSMDIIGERTEKPEPGDTESKGDDAKEEPAVGLEELQETMALIQGSVADLDEFAITHATIWTLAGETIEDGTVLVRDGKITAVGRDLEVPRKARVFDAAGGHVIPGIIDAHAHIAIEGGVNEGSLAVTAMVGIEDVVNPDDIGIYRALAGGVTSANLLHGSANPIGGKNQVVKMRWGADAEGMKFVGAIPGIKFALGENPKRSNFRPPSGTPQRYPQTRMGVMDVIREAFTEAREYQKEWQAYETGAPNTTAPRRDFAKDALVEILEGKRLVHSHCYRADEILQLMRLAEDFGFRIGTLQHVLEGYKVADEIAAHGAGASTFSDWWGYKIEAYDAIPHNAALMSERGVVVSINSDSGEEMRHLNQEAAKAVKWGGMSEVEALKLVTLNPARQFRIDDRVGSIEVGKDADLVIYDGHPLAIRSVVQQTFVDGDLYFDIEADRRRQNALDTIKARLDPKDDEEEKESDTGSPDSEPSPAVIWQDAAYSCREVH